MSNIFTYTLEIKTEKYQRDHLKKIFRVARKLYNQVLSHGLQTQKLFRKDELYKKYIEEKNYKKLNELKKFYGFTEYQFQEYLKLHRYKYKHLIDSSTAQKIATRTYKAIEEYQYGKRGKPRFKRADRFRSIEGKSNKTGIRFKNNQLYLGKNIYQLKFENSDLENYSLQQKVKYCRIVKKEIRGKIRFYLQLVLDGKPFKKNRIYGTQTVGLDLGPQTIAVTTKNYAELKLFAAELMRENKLEGKIQKKIQKKKRLLNPQNFEGKKLKKGKHKWKRSNKLKKLESKYRNLKRKNKEKRKELHGRLIRELLELGVDFKIEKINYSSWQKLFGKSIGAKAPGLFIEMLRRKAENAGGRVIEFSTYNTKLSQTCLCGKIKKKSLSERFHICDCGLKIQRDLLSSYLGIFVENDKLDLNSAREHYFGFEQPGREAIQNLLDSRASLKPFGFSKSELENQLLKL